MNCSSTYFSSDLLSTPKSVPLPSLFPLSSQQSASSITNDYGQPDQTRMQNQSYLPPTTRNPFEDNLKLSSVMIDNQQTFNQPPLTNLKLDQHTRTSFARQSSHKLSYSLIPHNIVPNVFYKKCERLHIPENKLKLKFATVPLSSNTQLTDPRLCYENFQPTLHLRSNRTPYSSTLSYSESSSLPSSSDLDFEESRFRLNTSTLSPSRSELVSRNKILKLPHKRTLDTTKESLLHNNFKMFKHESNYEKSVIDLTNLENLVIVKPLIQNPIIQSSSNSSGTYNDLTHKF